MNRARITALFASGAVSLAVASTALGATPRQIYNDYAAHGTLTQHYSKADLQRALSSTLMKGYGHGHQPAPTIHRIVTAPARSQGGLPFTGMDLGLITFGAILLLAFGGLLRRFARART